MWISLQAAKDVVLANKPIITDDSATLEPALLKTLMEQISTLASVYHKPADTFVSRQRLAVQTVDTLGGRPFEEEDANSAAAAAQVGTAWAMYRCAQAVTNSLMLNSHCLLCTVVRSVPDMGPDLQCWPLCIVCGCCRLVCWTTVPLPLPRLLPHQHQWWTCWVMTCWAGPHQQHQHLQHHPQQVCYFVHIAFQALGSSLLR